MRAKVNLLLLDYEQSLFLLVRRAKHARYANDQVRGCFWRHRRSRARALPSLSLRKRETTRRGCFDYCTRAIIVDVGGAYAGSGAATRKVLIAFGYILF